MNLFSASFLARHRLKLIFMLVWLHVSLLDLFYLTYNGPVFLWHENGQLLTIIVHFSIATLTVGFYWLMHKIQTTYSRKLG
ncbi:MAG: hypothetical protein OQK03_14405 [Colwellia sp.]|nr:hypothetical protein [Colwellia sp.]MCW8865107.1 hypothetical protein [Colwellia sp.]